MLNENQSPQSVCTCFSIIIIKFQKIGVLKQQIRSCVCQKIFNFWEAALKLRAACYKSVWSCGEDWQGLNDQ